MSTLKVISVSWRVLRGSVFEACALVGWEAVWHCETDEEEYHARGKPRLLGEAPNCREVDMFCRPYM